MDEKIISSMAESVTKTFEEMAFMDVSYAGNEKKEINFSHVLFIDILEPVAARVILYMPFECKKKLAENVYSKIFDELTSEEIDDCQLELLNVIAGNFLFNNYGSLKYKLDLPHIIFDEKELRPYNESYELYFNAEDMIFKIMIMI